MNKNLKIWHLATMAVATCVFAIVFQIVTRDMAANGGQMYDYLIFGYDLEFFRHNQFLLGSEGLNIYRYQALPLDMIYPFFYAITALIAWEMLIKTESSKLYWAGAALIMAVVVLDYGENIRLGMMLFHIQPASRSFIESTSLLTTVKWAGIAATLLLIFGFAVRKRLAKKRMESTD